MKDLYSGNFKTLKKEIEEKSRKWKDFPCLCVGRIIVVKKIVILSNAIYRSIKFNARSIKTSMKFLIEFFKNPKIYMETQKTWDGQRGKKNPEQ